eukprot:COSAG03_NODE_10529_length_645_cov_0.935897_3_plen_32_part_01
MMKKQRSDKGFVASSRYWPMFAHCPGLLVVVP